MYTDEYPTRPIAKPFIYRLLLFLLFYKLNFVFCYFDCYYLDHMGCEIISDQLLRQN